MQPQNFRQQAEELRAACWQQNLSGGAGRNLALLTGFFTARNGTERNYAMRVPLAVLLFFLVCLSTIPAWALRCGNRLVSLGEPQTAILYKCGAPDTTDRRVTYRVLSDNDSFGVVRPLVYIPVVIDVWVYNFGPQRFMQELSFEDGRLIDIESLGYGY